MSSGLSTLQNSILDRLPQKPLLFNQLLWEMALERGEIASESKYGILEGGQLQKSFSESLRRSVKNLEERGKIARQKRKFVDLEELLDHYQFVTNYLPLHQLRTLLRNDLSIFLKTQKVNYRNLDFEYFQSKYLKDNDSAVFSTVKNIWVQAESCILSNISDIQNERKDIVLDILCRGRYLFYKRAEFKMPLYVLVEQLEDIKECGDACLRIKELLSILSSMDLWKAGAIKDKLYDVLNVYRFSNSSLNPELKEFLLKKQRDLISSLPGHVEPQKIGSGFFRTERKFDIILDKLLDRNIFKPYVFLTIA